MSRISDVSSRLGEYMLRGWVLTDEGCDVCSIPMLRSPTGQSPVSMFCAQCQSTPDVPAPSAPTPSTRVIIQPPPSTASTSSESISRVSTPPTEVSSTLSSPTFAPPPDPQETMRRRAQSDHASAEIGKRMLRGWAMLAEECPNDSCYGVPLVRPPKPGGGKDPRKECVVCGNVYVFAKDTYGVDRLVRLDPTAPAPPATSPEPIDNSAARTPIVSGPSHVDVLPQPVSHDPHGQATTVRSNTIETTPPQILAAPPTISVLNDSIRSLERSLSILSNRLTSLCTKASIDHVSMGEIAISMERATNALRTLKHLHYQETSSYV